MVDGLSALASALFSEAAREGVNRFFKRFKIPRSEQELHVDDVVKRYRSEAREVKRKYRRDGVDRQSLNEAVAEVELGVRETANDFELVALADGNREAFSAAYSRRVSPRRWSLSKSARRAFDELSDLGSETVAEMGPDSPRYKFWRARGRGGWQFLTGRPNELPNSIARSGSSELVNQVMSGSARRMMLMGMPGVGKTQLAATVAQRCRDEGWPLVAWIDASSRESLIAGLAELGYELGVNSDGEPTPEAMAERCLKALKASDAQNRLIVLDGVQNMDDLAGWIPDGPGLKLLATSTQRSGWAKGGWAEVNVSVFTREESIEFLLNYTGQDDRDSANELAELLEDLPAALELAAADIYEKGWGIGRYVQRLQQEPWYEVLTVQPGLNYSEHTFDRLHHSFNDVLKRLSPEEAKAAGECVRSLAMFPDTGLPKDWLLANFDNKIQAKETLTALIKASICQVSEDRSVNLNPLYAQFIRQDYADKELTGAALSMLRSARLQDLPKEDLARRAQEASSLIERLQEIPDQPLLLDSQAAEIVDQAMGQAIDLGFPEKAASLDASVDALSESLGADHSAVLKCRYRLGRAYSEAGRGDEATKQFAQYVQNSPQGKDPNMLLTIDARESLARAYWEQGKQSESVKLFEENLARTLIGEMSP